MEKKAPREYRAGQHVRIELSGGRIDEAKIAAVISRDDGVRLQVDFGNDETALVELWQVVELGTVLLCPNRLATHGGWK
jgi:hypothetical protein